MNEKTIAVALLVLRLTLGLFLLQWGAEKFVMPNYTPAIWGAFYGVDMPATAGYVFGAIEIALALCFFAGAFRTVAYAAGMLLHAISIVVSWKQLLHPWEQPANHLFVASIPALGAFAALFLLRRWDRPLFAGKSPAS